MHRIADPDRRQTNADLVFQRLYDDIISLDLLPGAKLSEADVAVQMGVSRQPVHDAFTRLGDLNLLQIQPQRATRVRRFSQSMIASARFIRLALELEILRRACAAREDGTGAALEGELAAQRAAVEEGDRARFHALDARFHARIAEIAGMADVFPVVLAKKAEIDRICVLSLKRVDEMELLVADHAAIADAVVRGDADAAETRLREHLSRIDDTIEAIRSSHGEYFDPDA